MFNLLDETKPLLARRGIPLGIYWGVTALGFVILLIVLSILHNPELVCRLIDALIPLKSIRGGSFYQNCKERSLKLKSNADRKKNIEGRAVVEDEKHADNNIANSINQGHRRDGL